MKRAKIIGALIAAVLGVIVILQNTQPVEVVFLFMRIAMPIAVLLGLTLLIGISIGLLISLKTFRKPDAIQTSGKGDPP
jgi:uncharacterized integral membrane protein